MKVLYTAFNGKNNSSKLLLDKIIGDKLYLKNSFITSVNSLIDKISDYDLVISFGQAPLKKGVLKIELIGRGQDYYQTDYNYHNLEALLKKYYDVKVSCDAGNYLCNNLYYHGLKYISDNQIKTKMIFIHIPKVKELDNIDLLASIFNGGKIWD